MNACAVASRLFVLVQSVAIALCMASVDIVWAGPSVFPSGVTRYDPMKAYNCDVLFSAPDGHTYLIDMNGHVLHVWNYVGEPAEMLSPALTRGVKGEVGVQLSSVSRNGNSGGSGFIPGQKSGRENAPPPDLTFGYVDWSGNIVWSWGTQSPGGAALQHHDWELLGNGNTLLLSHRSGRVPGFGSRLMLNDVLYEINRAGKVVWTWNAAQHLDQMLPLSGLRLMYKEAAADYLHINAVSELGPNRWAASGDERFAPDNILISSRNGNFIAIISHESGKIVWRLGPFPPPRQPYAPKAILHIETVPFRVDALSGQHDAHMIPRGLPGAGDILVFDNEGEGGYPPAVMPMIAGSRVLEINPVTREVVWEYTGTKQTFFSPFIGSAQRLANGNTLIDEGFWGRLFQVTPDGRIVWEYMSPFSSRRAPDGIRGTVRWIYRAQAVPYDWVPKAALHPEVAVRPTHTQ